PLYFRGANSPLFQVLGLLHPRLRTALLPHEFFNKQHAEIEVCIGSLVSPKKMESFSSDAALTRYLRHRTYLLDGRRQRLRANGPAAGVVAAPGGAARFLPQILRRHTNQSALQSVVAPVPAERLAAEVSSLPSDQLIAQSGEFSVYLARAHEIP